MSVIVAIEKRNGLRCLFWERRHQRGAITCGAPPAIRRESSSKAKIGRGHGNVKGPLSGRGIGFPATESTLPKSVSAEAVTGQAKCAARQSPLPAGLAVGSSKAKSIAEATGELLHQRAGQTAQSANNTVRPDGRQLRAVDHGLQPQTRCLSGFRRDVDQDVAGLSSRQCCLLCDHRDDDRAQSAIVRVALDHYCRPKLGTASLAEGEINHHHITAVGSHDRLSHYEGSAAACPSGMVQSSSSKTSAVSTERSSGSQGE